jgi:uncharacterized protein YfaS (alpha-2-macroglobulin family)
VIRSAILTTNEFGSYNGSFVLPQGSMNGYFQLIDSTTGGNISVSMEEYKRPTFQAIIEQPTGTYRLGDSITVTGSAKAYAGSNIDGATVKYNIIRKVQAYTKDPYFKRSSYNKYGYRSYTRMPQVGYETVIADGITTTDAKGTFQVSFKTIPDATIPQKAKPIFAYEMTADITDQNGETRSTYTTVNVGYQSLQLSIDIPEKIAADSLKNIPVKATNLNDVEDTALIQLTVQRLQAPTRIFKERYWDQPDQFIMSRKEYYNYFPYDIYSNENEITNYDVVDTVYSKTDSSDHSWTIDNKWHSGYYKLTAIAKDKYGTDVTTIKYIQLTTKDDKLSEPISIDANKNSLEPGENLRIGTATGFKKIWLINTVQKMNGHKITSYSIVNGDSLSYQTIPVTESDRGGIGILYAFVQHNRMYSGTQSFDVPWTNKDLNITLSTFRDKLLPGAKDTWSLKITGHKKDTVAAEVLASMYDASLDQFNTHRWTKPFVWTNMYIYNSWGDDNFHTQTADQQNDYIPTELDYNKQYDRLIVGSENGDRTFNTDGYFQHDLNPDIRWNEDGREANDKVDAVSFAVSKRETNSAPQHMKLPKGQNFDDADGDGVPDQMDREPNTPPGNKVDVYGVSILSGNSGPAQVRKNFNEVAFFYPNLRTDSTGSLQFSFTMPDAVTQWKMMTLAHTKQLASGYMEHTIVTQKPLMIQANAPRFLREADSLFFSAKITNITDTLLQGNAQLTLIDAATGLSVNVLFKNALSTQRFTVAPGQSIVLKFPIRIPVNFNSALTYRIIAQSDNFSDGEEMTIPVLSNRTLVTESLPLNLRGNDKQSFTFTKLLNSNNSKTLSNHALTVEYTTNPAWYAVQALPYLMEYPYECAEQTFNRYYANALATSISNSTPKIKAVFNKWRTTDTAALISNLEKNEDLKQSLVEETPWVLDAQNETQQKKNIALLFDMVRMSNEKDKALNKLKDMQTNKGGFAWFKGGWDDRYITQYIITGIGHLKKLGVMQDDEYQKIKPILDKAIPYLDEQIKDDYDYLVKNYISARPTDHLNDMAIQYLYMRSFFPEYKIPLATQKAYNYFTVQAKQYWITQSKYMQAMIALALYKTEPTTATGIIRSLKENAIDDPAMGMYWKEWTSGGYYWYEAPIESQALMIEAFSTINKNDSTIADLTTWLLKQKQTQNWHTTKSTAEACYALLLNNTQLLSEAKSVNITLGDTTINSDQQKDEAGTGYFKTKIEGKDVKPQMGNITVDVESKSISQVSLRGDLGSWGSVYWQYFEDLDKITPATSPLSLKKKLFITRNTDKGIVLDAIDDSTKLHIGDKITVRIELKVDRDMEYVQMKDMRAACMEPVNVLSEYKWQDGLGYYESTKDASTNFFFDTLPKGSYIFEYQLFVTNSGNFSNGITNIQCMYAPEFTSHSEGIRINVAP